MKIIFNKRVYVFALLLYSITMMGQEFGKVAGKVSLSGNTAAENIAVTLKGTKYSDVTTVSGQYEITRVKPGNYTIVVSALGIDPVEANIVVTAKQTTTKNFSLNESQEDLQEVVITKNKNKQDKNYTPEMK